MYTHIHTRARARARTIITHLILLKKSLYYFNIIFDLQNANSNIVKKYRIYFT